MIIEVVVPLLVPDSEALAKAASALGSVVLLTEKREHAAIASDYTYNKKDRAILFKITPLLPEAIDVMDTGELPDNWTFIDPLSCLFEIAN